MRVPAACITVAALLNPPWSFAEKPAKSKGKSEAQDVRVVAKFTASQRNAAMVDGDLLKLAVGTMLVVDAIDGLVR